MTPKRNLAELIGSGPTNLLTVALAQQLFAPIGSVALDLVKQSELDASVLSITNALSSKAALNHGHFISEISGLQAALEARQPLNPQLSNLASLLTSGNAGKVIAVNANGTGFELVTVQGNAVVAPPPPTVSAPTNTVAPAISGTAISGQTLSVSNGTWTNSPTAYAYQWKRAGVAILNATASTYALAVGDEGTSVTCTVTATNVGGSNSATSNAISVTAPPSTGSATTYDPTLSAPVIYYADGYDQAATYPIAFKISFQPDHLPTDKVRLILLNMPDGSEALNVAVTAGTGNVTFPGLSAITSGTHRLTLRMERGSVYGIASNYLDHGPDNVAPVLTSLSSAQTGQTSTSVSFTTDTGEGNAYVFATTTNVAPSKATMAGKTANSITLAGAKTFAVSGLTPGTLHYAWAMHTDASGNQSEVTAAGSFTTIAANVSVAKLAIGSGSTGAGVDRSQYISCTDGFTATAVDTGAQNLIKSPDAPGTKFHFEATFALSDPASVGYIGVTDAARAVGPAIFSRPGSSGNGDGFTIDIGNAYDQFAFAFNGASITSPAGSNSETGIIVSLDVDTVANTILVRRKQGGTINTVGSYTLTSQIPTNWRAFVGQRKGDTVTANFGASPWAIPPASGFSGW